MTDLQPRRVGFRRQGRRPFSITRGIFRSGLAFLVAVLLLVIPTIEFRLGEPARTAWFLAGGVALLLIVVFQRVENLTLLSPAVAYALVFWAFHFGLIFPASLFPSVLDQFASWDIWWLYYPEGGKATLLALLFLGAFLSGVMLVTSPGRLANVSRTANSTASELVATGRLVIAGGLLLAFIGMLQFGFNVFFRSYAEFFQIHNTFSWAVVVIAFGHIALLAGGRNVRSVIRDLLWAYLPIAFLTFLAGARTAPMFSAVVVGVALTLKGFRLPRTGLWVSLFVVLLSISLIRETRQYGLGEVLTGQEIVTESNPLSGITEMGGSLRPVAMTIHYLDVAHNRMLMGQTYVFPLWRQVQRVLGMSRSNPEADPRFISAHISRLYSAAMGYSVVAEAYVNLGTFGVLLFALVWGVVLGALELHSAKPYGLALLGAVLIPMMINIRNSFIFVPAWIFLGVLVLLFSRFFVRPLMARRNNRRRFSQKNSNSVTWP